jgi:hypothetical protein
MDLPAAEKAIRQGSDLGFFVAILSLLGVILATTMCLGGVCEQWNDPWLLLDVAIFAGLAPVRSSNRTVDTTCRSSQTLGTPQRVRPIIPGAVPLWRLYVISVATFCLYLPFWVGRTAHQ